MHKELDYFKSRLIEINPDILEEDLKKALGALRDGRWVKQKNGEWKSRSGLAGEVTEKEYFDLSIAKNNLPEKPDSSEQATAASAAFNKFPHKFLLAGKTEVVEEASVPSLLNYIKSGSGKKLKNTKPNHYILLKSVLCTSLPFVNANGDAFDPDDLVNVVKSGQLDKFQPAIIDWHHDFYVYGHTIGAEIRDESIDVDVLGKVKVKQIVVYSVFQAWLFPYKADKIRIWAEKGILAFSMACGAESVDFLNNGSVRVLRNPHFVANSIIPPDSEPADENANLIEIASAKEKIPIINSSFEEDHNKNNWYVNEDNNTGDKIMLTEKEILAIQDEIKKLKEANNLLQDEIKGFKESEDAKKVEALEAEKKVLEEEVKTLKEASEVSITEIETLKTDKVEAEKKLTANAEALKELRGTEVERLNKERTEKIAELDLTEDQQKYWESEYTVALDDEGEIMEDQEDFDEFVANMKVKMTPEEESEFIKASRKVVPTKTKTESGVEFDSMA